MIETIETTNYILSLLGIGAGLVASVLVIDLYTSRVFTPLIRRTGLLLAFLTTLVGTIMAFVYSEYFGLVPCGLCWMQRVFLFSQVVVIGTAIFYRDALAARYGIALSIAGFIVGVYQHYIQMGGSEFIKCPAAGAGADCAKRYLFEFGFMTYPLLSAIVFAFLIALYVYILKTRTV
jgi:disulfide bond formation protein DsbB